MSQLSQLVGGVSPTSTNNTGVPIGSLTAQYNYTTTPLLDTPQGVFIKSGASVAGVSSTTLSKVRSANMGYDAPSTAMGVQIVTSDPAAAIVAGGGVYLRSSRTGMLRSTDGITWTTVPMFAVNSSYGLQAPPVYFNSQWVVVSKLYSTPNIIQVLTSPDGLTWTAAATLPASGSNNINVSVTNSRIYISFQHYAGTTYSQLYYSTDGNVFVMCTMPNSHAGALSAVVWSGTVYVVGGTASAADSLISTDGVVWTAQNTVTAVSKLFYVNGLFIASNGASMYTSPAAGTTWTSRTNPAGNTISSAVYAAGLFVAGILSGSASAVITSSDGVTWTNRTLTTAAGAVSVIFDGTAFLAAGYNSGTLHRSTDGITWSPVTIPFTSTPYSIDARRLLYTGSSYWLIDGHGSIQKSTDGTTWTRVLSCSPATSVNMNRAVKKVNGYIFYLPNNGGIQATPVSSGTDWSIKFNSTVVFNDIAFGNGQYVAVGAAGAVYTSPDMATWTSRSAGASNHYAVCYGAGMYVITGGYNGAYSSPDSTTWTSRASGLFGYATFAVYFGGRFVVTGYGSTIYASPDGITWASIQGSSAMPYTSVTGQAIITYGSPGAGARVITNSGQVSIMASNIVDAVGYNTVTDTYYISYNSGSLGTFVGLSSLLNASSGYISGSSQQNIAFEGGGQTALFAEFPGTAATIALPTGAGANVYLSTNAGYFFYLPGCGTPISLTPASTVITGTDYMIVSDSASFTYYKRDSITANASNIGSTDTVTSLITSGYASFYRRVG